MLELIEAVSDVLVAAEYTLPWLARTLRKAKRTRGEYMVKN